MAAALIRKLQNFVPLTPRELALLERLGRSDERFEADREIVGEGQVPRSVFMVVEGMACRYRIMPDGRRQIMTFLIPGDMCDLHVFLLRSMDHSIGSLTPVRIAAVERDDLLNIAALHPRISLALWWSTLQEEAMLRERIVSLGRRRAIGRVAYLLCELVWRYKAIGQSNGDTIALPLTQHELADALGLTPIHINRVLQELRREKLVTLEHRKLVLLNMKALSDIAEFNHDYLHLGPAPQAVTNYFEQLES
jgi:CRP-like cAMP-binding protein